MSRFTGFQNERGVAVLDTLTGELVFHPFDGGDPTTLRPAVVAAPAGAEARPMALPLAGRPDDEGQPTGSAVTEAGLRAARRLDRPRPMVISYPDADQVAIIKAARLARNPRQRRPREDAPSQDED